MASSTCYPIDDLSTPIFESQTVRIGTFRCPANHLRFVNSGPIRQGHLIVFPRLPVQITLPGIEPIVATPNVVMFYNHHQDYRRAQLCAEGDRCEWFAIAPTLIREVMLDYKLKADDCSNRPFAFAHAPSDAHTYLRQRLIVAHIVQCRQQREQLDALWINEQVLLLLDQLFAHLHSIQNSPPPTPKRQTYRSQAEIVRFLQEYLATHFTHAQTIHELATLVHLSPYELCRIFRRHTGLTIHRYLTQLRLRTALEILADHPADLTAVALDLGYSSHSHFTAAFRRNFGLPPSYFCKNYSAAIDKVSAKMRKDLIA